MNKPEARGDGVRASAWDKLELLEDRAELCSEWLSLTASMMKGVRRGVVILRGERGGELSPHAVWPEDGGVPELLVGAALVALKTGECITPGEGADASDRIVQPLTTDGELWGVIALEVDPRSIERLHGLQRGLQASSGWLMRLGRAREERTKVAEEPLETAASFGSEIRWAVKPLLLLLTATLSFASLWSTDYSVNAAVRVAPGPQALIKAPFSGQILEAPVDVGDVVREGALLYKLDDSDLRLEKEQLERELVVAEREHLRSLAAGDAVALNASRAEEEELKERIATAAELLTLAAVRAPVDGVVVSGALCDAVGASVDRGQATYVLSALDGVRVSLFVDEEGVDELAIGQEGVARLAGGSESGIGLRIGEIGRAPVLHSGEESFEVEVRLLDETAGAELRPGMIGEAEVVVGERILLKSLLDGLSDLFGEGR